MKAVFGFFLLIIALVFLYLGRDDRDEVRSWNRPKKVAARILYIVSALACALAGIFLLVSFLFL